LYAADGEYCPETSLEVKSTSFEAAVARFRLRHGSIPQLCVGVA